MKITCLLDFIAQVFPSSAFDSKNHERRTTKKHGKKRGKQNDTDQCTWKIFGI